LGPPRYTYQEISHLAHGLFWERRQVTATKAKAKSRTAIKEK
jgi:hypothetical protein